MLIDPVKFLQLADRQIIVDVRSPLEYQEGHIPGALNIPIFSNEERKVVGTLYKQVGRDQAILKGLELVGPKLSSLVTTALQQSKDRELLVHCWRGGLRSKNMAWLFELAGFRVHILEGGYKAYRRHIREELNKNENIVILGGKTGSGKTEILRMIQQEGFQILNLEGIACHKGSAFGDLGQDQQPSNEQFENNLYQAISLLDTDKITWVEDESRGIGRVGIPEPFFNLIRNTHVIFLDVPKPDRVQRLVIEYADFPRERLSAAINRISKKLGGLNTKQALEALEENNFAVVADILLSYYDKAYLKGLSIRDQSKVYKLNVNSGNPEENAKLALDYYKKDLASHFNLINN